MIKSPFILKEKTQQTVANGEPDLALPEETGRQIGRASDKNIICATSGIFREMEIILDEVVEVQVGLGIFDFGKLEGF